MKEICKRKFFKIRGKNSGLFSEMIRGINLEMVWERANIIMYHVFLFIAFIMRHDANILRFFRFFLFQVSIANFDSSEMVSDS